MGLSERIEGLRESWRPGHALLVIPLALIVVITVVDLLAPADIHLGPLLVIAPAITASFAGPLSAGVIGVLAVAAQAFIGLHFGILTSRSVLVQIAAIAVLSALVVFFCLIRERHGQELARVRSVAEAAQQVLLWPLPDRIGPLRVASLYLAAEDEALIGGDLYAATRTGGGTHVMIGDVRGKGLAAIGEAALLLGAFREAAHQHASLPALAAALERSVGRYQADFEPESEAGERFVTALLLEIPDGDPIIRMTSCGHPAPLLLSPGHSVTVPSLHPAPPLGVGGTGQTGYTVDVFTFEDGDTLLLYTDGVIEARGREGDFYPFAERAARWTDSSPEMLLRHLRRDLLAHAGGYLGDDAAVIAIHRIPAVDSAGSGLHHGKAAQSDGFRHGSGRTGPAREC
ncbi:PP2C family protein-serine/threonine phosphatase [Streptomyces sp. NPDC058092]|uniref:PP2C family protein-serine/threonine phosphatase n=1 Tax=Streptomyces sp. NPDC058092 TaxID=3346336 RepID=UPI0036EE3AFD